MRTKSVSMQCKFYEEKDLESAHTLITSNLRYVVKVAPEYSHYGLKMIDLNPLSGLGSTKKRNSGVRSM